MYRPTCVHDQSKQDQSNFLFNQNFNLKLLHETITSRLNQVGLPYQGKTQYLQILNIVDKHQISGQSTTVVKVVHVDICLVW